MERDEPQAIYDFLYKDLIICNSLYSQFFRGLLTSTKNASQSIEGTDKTGEASFPGLAKGQFTKKNSSNLQLEESLDPHDIIVMETLAKLAPSAKRPCDNLSRGDIIVCTGQLHIFNRPQICAALDVYEQFLTYLPKGTPNKKAIQEANSRETKAGIALIQSMMATESTDARYIMISEEMTFSGMLRSSALTSSLEGIAFSFSGEPITPITLFGIVERPSLPEGDKASAFPEESLNYVMQTLNRSLSDIGLNSNTTSAAVKPIAIYSPLNL